MSKQADFLLEIGTEELPPLLAINLLDQFKSALRQSFNEEQITFDRLQGYVTPRRLALVVKGLPLNKPDYIREKRGPALQQAYDAEGRPTKACLGFARSLGIDVSNLEVVDADDRQWVVYRQSIKGELIETILPELINQVIKSLSFPRAMRWSDKPYTFIRPVHWVVMLLENKVLTGTLFGVKVDDISFGHRFMSPAHFSITHASTYEAQLESAYVIADFDKRRNLILKEINEITQKYKCYPIIDDKLLDEVTNLVEYPVALMGTFNDTFLNLPAEILITTIQYHQKCFAVKNAQGELLAKFVTISHIKSKNPAQVVEGNERVMAARLADAQFFYQQDIKRKLSTHLANLKSIQMHEKLGTLKDKTKRLVYLSEVIAIIINKSSENAMRAAELSKFDLCTEVVHEFPELQGTMGYYYALYFGESEEVAKAILEQYWPQSANHRIPESDAGCILALAERIDNLVGYFGIGLKPTGIKDPFSLRRAAIGIVRIILEKQLFLPLDHIIEPAISLFKNPLEPATLEDVKEYILERMRQHLLDQGVRTDVIASVFALNIDDLWDNYCRIEALMSMATLPDVAALSAANKRVRKLLMKAEFDPDAHVLDPDLFQTAVESDLLLAIESMQATITPLLKDQDYKQVISALATMRPHIDRFFDEIMVMVADLDQRNNRLSLLYHLQMLFMQMADISLLQLDHSNSHETYHS